MREYTAYRTCPLCEATCGLEILVQDGVLVEVSSMARALTVPVVIKSTAGLFGRVGGDSLETGLRSTAGKGGVH